MLHISGLRSQENLVRKIWIQSVHAIQREPLSSSSCLTIEISQVSNHKIEAQCFISPSKLGKVTYGSEAARCPVDAYYGNLFQRCLRTAETIRQLTSGDSVGHKSGAKLQRFFVTAKENDYELHEFIILPQISDLFYDNELKRIARIDLENIKSYSPVVLANKTTGGMEYLIRQQGQRGQHVLSRNGKQREFQRLKLS